MNGALVTSALEVGYGERVVAGPVSMRVERGAILALVGANGSGKSTLLRTLAGLAQPLGGSVQMGDEDVHAWDEAKRSRRVAYLDQAPRLAAALSVREVVAMGQWRGGFTRSTASHARIDGVLDELSLTALHDVPWTSLSQGQRQRTALARALAQDDCGVLILDEPFAAQDTAATVACAAALVRRARGGGTVIASIHDADLARAIATHALRLPNDGCTNVARAVLSPASVEESLSCAALEAATGVSHWRGADEAGTVRRTGPDWSRAVGSEVERRGTLHS